MTKLTKAFFALLRLGISDQSCQAMPPPGDVMPVDWERLFAFSARQGAVLLTYGGIQHLPAEYQPPRKLKLRWVANVVKGSERDVRYRQVVSELSHLFSNNGMQMLLVKGLTLSKLYPIPYYREGGDADIYLFGGADRADAIAGSLGIPVQHPTAKHSAFVFKGVMVENHRTFFDTNSSLERENRLYRKMERMLTGMISPGNCPGTYIGLALELPAQAAALFLIGHTFRHFCGEGINSRQLCDWTMLLGKRRAEIDFDLLARQIRELHLEDFVAAINSFCRANLGFEPAFLASEKREGASERLILKMISGYRRTPPIHVPVAGVLRHLLFRNRIYNRYLGKCTFREFLQPELKLYFAWLLKRIGRRGV